MRVKGRRQGRFVSLSGLKKLPPPPGSQYPLLIVDATGLPVFFLCEWYRRHKEGNPGRTADTYLYVTWNRIYSIRNLDYVEYSLPILRSFLKRRAVFHIIDMALPWAGFLLQHGYAWNDRPDRIRAFLIEFLRTDVKCLVGPDAKREESLLVETTGASPLSKSSLGVLLAALTDLYDTLIGAGYYVHPNPLHSERMIALKRDHMRQVKNAGAPDHAGIRGESWSETNRAFQTSQFRQRRGKVWEPQVVLEPDAVQERIRQTIDFMVQHASFQRDQVILLLLRQTGARLSEIVEMTAGGYRSACHAGRALVKNKGSQGHEEKTIYFTQTIDQHLRHYIRTERAGHDPQGRKRLEDLDDRDPLFLTRTGKPYTRSAFYYNWKKLFVPAQHQFEKQQQVEFTPHDLRHLRVTRTVTKMRQEAQGNAALEAELLEGFQHLMGWRSRETMTTYMKTINKRKALEALLADEEECLGDGQVAVQMKVAELPASEEVSLSPAMAVVPPSYEDEELGWYEE